MGSRRFARNAGLALAAALAVVALMLVPVAAQGGLGEFRYYALEKGEYVRSASISYLDSLDSMGPDRGPAGDPLPALESLVFAVPLVGLIALAAAARSTPGWRATLGIFTLGALASCRATSEHLPPQLRGPFAAISSRGRWPGWRRSWTRGGRSGWRPRPHSPVFLLATAWGGLVQTGRDAPRGEEPATGEFIGGPLSSEADQRALERAGAW